MYHSTRTTEQVGFCSITEPMRESDQDGGAETAIHRLRNNSHNLDDFKSRTVRTINSYGQMPMNEMITANILSQLSSVGKDALVGSLSVDIGAELVKLVTRSVIVSDQKITQSVDPSAVTVDLQQDVSLWVDKNCVTRRTVQLSGEPSESLRMNKDATRVVTFSNYSRKDLVDALNLGKKEVDDIQQVDRDDLRKNMITMSAKHSRMLRLVQGMLYLLALQTGGSDGKVYDVRLRKNDVIREQSVGNLITESSSNDTAYVYCPDGSDENFIAFCYLISRRLGTIPHFFTKKASNGKQLYFRCSGLEIPEEADRICIFTRTKSTHDGISGADIKNVSFSAARWYGYLVDYAKANQIDNRLAEAKAIACVLMYHEFLPSVVLEKPVSSGERFHRALANDLSGTPPPLMTFSSNEVIGGCTVALSAFLLFRDIKSNELTKKAYESVQMPHNMFLGGDRFQMSRMSRLIFTNGLNGAAIILEKVGAFFCQDDRYERLLMNKDYLVAYACMPASYRDYSNAIKNGLCQLLHANTWKGSLPSGSCSSERIARMDAFMSQLGILDGSRHKSMIFIGNRANYDLDSSSMAYFSNMLREGDIGLRRVSRILHCAQYSKFKGSSVKRRKVAKVRENVDRQDKRVERVPEGTAPKGEIGKLPIIGRLKLNKNVTNRSVPPIEEINISEKESGESNSVSNEPITSSGTDDKGRPSRIGFKGSGSTTDNMTGGIQGMEEFTRNGPTSPLGVDVGEEENDAVVNERQKEDYPEERDDSSMGEDDLSESIIGSEGTEEAWNGVEKGDLDDRIRALDRLGRLTEDVWKRLEVRGEEHMSGEIWERDKLYEVVHTLIGENLISEEFLNVFDDETVYLEDVWDELENIAGSTESADYGKISRMFSSIRISEISWKMKMSDERINDEVRADREAGRCAPTTLDSSGSRWDKEEIIRILMEDVTQDEDGISKLVANYRRIDHSQCVGHITGQVNIAGIKSRGVLKFILGTKGVYCTRCIMEFDRRIAKIREEGLAAVKIARAIHRCMIKGSHIENVDTLKVAFESVHSYRVIFYNGYIGKDPKIKAHKKEWIKIYHYIIAGNKETKLAPNHFIKNMTLGEFVKIMIDGDGVDRSITKIAQMKEHNNRNLFKENRKLLEGLIRLAREDKLPTYDVYRGDDGTMD
jgi:hypothetical protein